MEDEGDPLLQQDDLAILQRCDDKELPPEVRTDFVTKVYSILCYMLGLTTLACYPMVFYPEKSKDWFDAHKWVPIVLSTFLIAVWLFNFLIIATLCCGGTTLLKGYIRMFKTSPWNYLFLTCFSIALGPALGGLFLQNFNEPHVGMLVIFGATAIIVIGLTVYAVKTQHDFTGYGAYIFVLVFGLIVLGCFFGIFAYFFPSVVKVWDVVYGCLAAIVFGFAIIYETQLIFGSSKGPERDYEYTLDLYAFAAFELYLSIINFIVALMRIFGDRT